MLAPALPPKCVKLSHRLMSSVLFLLVALGGFRAGAAEPPKPSAGSHLAEEPAAPMLPDLAARCAGLAGGRFNLLPGAPTEIVTAALVQTADQPYCDVEGYVNPTDNFGLWLPVSHWNGKYIVRGCGGSCGAVATNLACPQHVRDGYACLITDMGHRSSNLDNVWVADNLQGQVEFGYRATHVTAVAGRAITEAFYGRAPRLSYFMGCSTGGRQAMVEAERFPGDFDGIVAIAPASMGALSGGVHKVPEPATYNRAADGSAILPNRKIPMLHRAVLAKCDMNDGVKDGLIGDPDRCAFDPASLLCTSEDNQNCLTAPQLAVVRRIYATGRAAVGSELAWINYYIHDTYPPPTNNPFTSRGDPATEETLISPANPDLEPFRSHGGKLILAHGWADPSVPPEPDIRYYELATRAMGGAAATQAFFRLFMIPGMEHCSGGYGAYGIDYIQALENWVEHMQAPDRLVGVHPKPGVALDFLSIDLPLLKPTDFAFTRAFYPYPLQSYYKGSGDPNDADNFVARQP